MIKILYVAECNLNKNSAYMQHVIRMCDSFSEKYKTLLLTPFRLQKKIKKFNLIKNDIIINNNTCFKNQFKINFIYRIFFSIKVVFFIKKENNFKLVITRSIISSFFMTLFNIRHYLELHHELEGLSKFLMITLKYIKSKKIIKIIFISNELRKHFKVEKKKSLVLHDAVNHDHFRFRNNLIKKKIKNIYYIGSFYKGKGVNIILKAARCLPDYNFFLVGANKNFFYKKTSNVKVINFIEYNKIPQTMNRADILLMMNEKFVSANSKNLNTANYCSPLKMFQYLASKKIIITTKSKSIMEILKNNKNCFTLEKNNHYELVKKILVINNLNNLNKIYYYCLQTAKKNTWKLRANAIISDFMQNA